MQERHTEQDYRALLIADTPIIDVRAPIEFEQGAMPAAINLPLMNNDERAAVGTCYKQQGSDAALALGHKLVAGEIRQQRIDALAGSVPAKSARYSLLRPWRSALTYCAKLVACSGD